ncbi:serine hydrolase [Priestia flexa]|uniref:serine hydrolase n=1 Tax=Priestia flexa TaxID=86664 RepID=UPI0028908C38|nr:serine hydrolase [Priestia flexa]MDT2047363.1 class A beta-lactamase-related serine hydrolase [Priestia flexa]
MSIVEEKVRLIVQQWSSMYRGRVSYLFETPEETIEQGATNVYPSASTIKLLVAIEACRQLDSGVILAHQTIGVKQSDIVGGDGLLSVYPYSPTATVKELLILMLILSDNTATNLLIKLLGQECIQGCIKDLGLKNTQLNRQMMDIQASAEGRDNVTTAADLLTCLKVLYRKDVLSEPSRKLLKESLFNQRLRDKLPSMLNEKCFILNKPGHLHGITHDCGVLFTHHKRCYAVVLIDGLKHNEYGRRLIADLGQVISEALTQQIV